MNIYDVAEANKRGSGAILEKFEALIEDLYAINDHEVERYLAVLLMKMADRVDEKPESILCDILSQLSDESIHYPFIMLHDSQGTKISGDLPPHIKMIVESRDKE